MIFAPGARAEESRTDTAESQREVRRLLAIAQELYLQEQWLDSGEAFLAAHEVAPVPALLANAGQAFRRGRACDRALECFRRYVDEDEVVRGDSGVQSALAAGGGEPGADGSCRAVERLSRAIFEADQATAEDRLREARGLAEDAQDRYLQGRYLDAAELFERAYELRPHRAFLWNIGQSYLRAAQWLESQLAFEHYLAESLVDVRRHPAVTAAIAALEAEPYAEDPRAQYLCRALCLAIERAECEQATAETSSCLLGMARRLAIGAEERFMQERFLEAAQLYEQVNDVHPDPAFAWNIGLSYLRAGQWLESERAFERYLAESPVEVRRHPAVMAATAALDAEPYAEDERSRALCDGLRSAIIRAEREQPTAESGP